MKMFTDNKIVTISDLQQSGLYSEKLLNRLMIGDFNKLSDLSVETRADIDYMEPLLYAIKNSELDTYQVFKYYAENLQNNFELASEIIMTEPNLIEGTPISGNRQFIMENATVKPEIIKYMSPQLKIDDQFINELSDKNNPEILKEIEENCVMAVLILSQPELSNNREFMSSAIDKDVQFLEYASDELKSDYTFMKEVCNNNKEAINYIAEHTDDFGEEGLTAAKEVLVEGTTSKAITEFEEELVTVKEKLEDNNEQQDEKELKQLEIRKRQLENNRKFIEKIKEGKVKPERAIRLIDSICKNLGEEYRAELMQYIKMDDAIIQKQQKESSEQNNEVQQEQNNNEENPKYTVEDIEARTSEVQIGNIREEINTTKAEFLKEEGEQTYEQSNDTRT